MNTHNARLRRLAIYVPCGATVWGVVACLERAPDWRVGGLSIVCGSLLGVLAGLMPSR